jgi:hypothetical protein
MRRLSHDESIAATVARNAQLKFQQILIDAQTERRSRKACFWFYLPPLAVFAESPMRCCHD